MKRSAIEVGRRHRDNSPEYASLLPGYGLFTVVPVHSGETIGPGLMSEMLRDCELSLEEMQKLF